MGIKKHRQNTFGFVTIGRKMANFDRTGQPKDDEDLIIIHVGHLSVERYNRVVESIIAFMNKRWPDFKTMGIDN